MTCGECDVAIVGLGPVGAVLANLLGLAGFSVVVLEQDKDVFDKPRASVCDHEALRVLQACKLPDDLYNYIGPYQGSDYVNESGEIIRKYYASLPPYPLGWPSSASFIQPDLERLLRSGFKSLPNVDVRLQQRVTLIDGDLREPVLTFVDLTTDKKSQLRARYVVGCDGGSSTIRKLLDVKFDDLQYDETWVVVDAWVVRDTPLPDMSRLYCWPSRPAIYVKGLNNFRRWEMKVLPNEGPEYFANLENVLHELNRYVDTSALEIWRAATYNFHALIARKWRYDGVFLAGDAAHMSPPFAGQGLCSGIRDAGNLAWKLYCVEKLGAQGSLLDTYEEERKAHTQAVIEHSKSIGHIIGELDPSAAEQRDNKMKEQLANGSAEIYRQRYIPALNEGLICTLQGVRSPAAGSLFVQPSVLSKQGGECLLDDLTRRRFSVIVKGEIVLEAFNERCIMLLRRLECVVVFATAQTRPQALDGEWMVEVSETGALLKDWFEERGMSGAVVRPDGYVFGAFQDASGMHIIVEELHRTLFGDRQMPFARADEIDGAIRDPADGQRFGQ